jgi:hypothetical protein
LVLSVNHAAILARREGKIEAKHLEQALRPIDAAVEQVDANVALDGSWTYVYFWTRTTELPDEALMRRIGARLEGYEVARLQPELDIAGTDFGAAAPYHYVVETDVEAHHVRELADWYAKEHLPGLAAVSGAVRARRLTNMDGAPRSFACYDLRDPSVLGSDAWLAVRASAWSGRVRPMFRNTRRTLFRRIPRPAPLT